MYISWQKASVTNHIIVRLCDCTGTVHGILMVYDIVQCIKRVRERESLAAFVCSVMLLAGGYRASVERERE